VRGIHAFGLFCPVGASLRDHVSHVVLMRSQVQVVWSYAMADIAFVKHVHAGRDWSKVKFPGNTVDTNVLSATAHLSV
jgi:hypothetical protein